MGQGHSDARRHRKALKQAAQWLHARAREVEGVAGDDRRRTARAAALRATARLCDQSASTMDCRAAKDAMTALARPEGLDASGWNEGVCGGLNGVNLHAQRNGVSPWRSEPAVAPAEGA